jgi:hypothetical protein
MQADFTPLGQDYTMLKSMAISGTLNWRYLPYIGLIQGLFKGISPENMAKNMVLTYLHQLDPEDLPLLIA